MEGLDRKIKQSELKTLENTLRTVLHKYIRYRDTFIQNGVRVGFCITCGKPYTFDKLEAGHFIASKQKSHKFDPQNINAQCKNCNRYNGGRRLEYEKAMIKKYGQRTVDLLHVKSAYNPTHLELEIKIKEYLEKLLEYEPDYKIAKKYK